MSNLLNDEERIAQLEAEILAKKAELKALKYRACIDYSIYRTFRDGVYDHCYSHGLSVCLAPAITALARVLVSVYEVTRNDGSKYLTVKQGIKMKDLSREQIAFCNDFANELYPLIEKYVNKIL